MKSLKDHRLSYSALNTARSALSISIPGSQTFGTHPLVSRFMKSVYEELRPQPIYIVIEESYTETCYVAIISFGPASCQFQVLEHMKTSKPGGSPTVITFQKYDQNANICPLLTLAEYLKQTKSLRVDDDQVLISYLKPYKAVSRDTISLWVKQVLADAGIYTNIYTPNSTGAASTSKAYGKVYPSRG